MNPITLLIGGAVGVLLARMQRIESLEAKIETLDERNRDLSLKARIVSSQLFGSPLANFFASPEFWENTYDSGQADCSRRCIETLTSERKACESIADPTQRQKCFEDAAQRASLCHQRCSGSFPPPL
jgi:hypothetical protein